MSAQDAQKRWELENEIQEGDAVFTYNNQEQQKIQGQKPWTKAPDFFKNVKISALALLKMAIHAKSGGNLEVMGIMQGKIAGDTFIVLDAFALPVEGTETRVNAQAEAYEYMIDFAESCKASGRLENAVGWYHSHPGYGCWLSGIDVNTQSTQQQFSDPFLAVVVDPHRTVAAGKVEIGAFRTYPQGYTPPDEPNSEYQSVPMNKIEDFGVHCKSYYSLHVSYFKSSLDSGMLELLWNKYWVNTLSSSPLLATKDLTNSQISDIAAKIDASDSAIQGGRKFQSAQTGGKKGNKNGGENPALKKLANDACTLSTEQIKGLSPQVVKSMLFNAPNSDQNTLTPSKASTYAVIPMES